LIGLINKIDETLAASGGEKKGFVVFLGEPSDALRKKIVDLAAEKKIEIPLVVPDSAPADPAGYAIAEDAHATVILYKKKVVKASYAYRQDEIDGQAIDEVVAAIKSL
jgi:hypothetical protein